MTTDLYFSIYSLSVTTIITFIKEYVFQGVMKSNIGDAIPSAHGLFIDMNAKNLVMCAVLDRQYKTGSLVYATRMYGAATTFLEHMETTPENRFAETAADVYLEAFLQFSVEMDKIKFQDAQKNGACDTLLAAQFMLVEPYFRTQNQRNQTMYPTSLEEFCQQRKK